MVKVLIADDHAVVRRGLKQIIGEIQDMEVAGEAASGHETLEQIRKGIYDILVLDLSMPGRDGLDTLKDIRREDIRIPVLVLSMHTEKQYALRALKDGASGYVTKDTVSEELASALKIVAGGRKYITQFMAERLAALVENESGRMQYETLSDREYQVLRLIASGLTVKQIGEELHLSVKTISTYRSRILEKMGMKTNAQLTRYVFENQLL